MRCVDSPGLSFLQTGRGKRVYFNAHKHAARPNYTHKSQLYRLYFHSYKHHYTLQFPHPYPTIPSPIVNHSFLSSPSFHSTSGFSTFFSLLAPLHLVLSPVVQGLSFSVFIPKNWIFLNPKIVFIFCVTSFFPFIPPPSLLLNKHSPSPSEKYFVLSIQSSLSNYSIVLFLLRE